MLWGRAAQRCAFPDCRCELVEDSSQTDAESIHGVECHIVAKKPKGPRGNSCAPAEELDNYANLILLCPKHHKIIDDQRCTYTVGVLREMKRKHIDWVRDSLRGFDQARQRADEIYADYTDDWAKRADIDNWKAWTSNLLWGGQPRLARSRDEELAQLRDWLLSRVWPGTYPALEAAFSNFRLVLCDLQEVFRKYAKPIGENDETLITEKFYQIERWDPPLYERLSSQYDFHVALVEDLALELTRAANFVCDKVREFISPSFRLREGALLVVSGMFIDLTCHTYRVEYRSVERALHPYGGLLQFKKNRKGRDVHFGEGLNVDDPEFRAWQHKE